MFSIWTDDGLGAGGNEAMGGELTARYVGAALWTFGPNGVPVPMPFVLPNGDIAIGVKARTTPSGGLGPGEKFDPNRDVKVLLRRVTVGGDIYSGQYAPGEAYSWPVVARPEVFITPGSAPGFPVKDFYCSFHPGVCDQLSRAAAGAGRNPCWGKPSGTCDPFKQPIGGGSGLAPASTSTTSVTSPSTASGATVGSRAIKRATAPLKTAPDSILSAGSSVLDQVSSAVGLPTKVDVAGFSVSPALIGVAALALFFFMSRR